MHVKRVYEWYYEQWKYIKKKEKESEKRREEQ